MPSQHAATDGLRRANTATVLRLLRDSGPLSRADISRRSGLAKATVGSIIAELTAIDAVREGASAAAVGRGRPSTPVALTGGTLVGLGVEINVNYVAVTIVDLAGREVLVEEKPIEFTTPAKVVELITEHAQRIEGEGGQLLGATIAVPGLMDRRGGKVVAAPNLGWYDYPLLEEVHEAVPGISVAIDNDANCAALAESLHGVASEAEDFVYLTGTVGIGAGIVTGGRVLRGGSGLAGEVGHMRMMDSDAECGCGRRGCWEAQVGLWAMAEAAQAPVRPTEDPVDYTTRLAAGDNMDKLHPVAQALSEGVAQLAAVLDPQMVVLGGAFVPLAELLVPACQERLDASFSSRECRVHPSALRLHAASLGAAIDALDDVWSGRRSLVR